MAHIEMEKVLSKIYVWSKKFHFTLQCYAHSLTLFLKVTDLDRKTVERHINKLRFYYGATDHWCPTHYYDNIKALFPDHKHLYLCDRGFRHAFIIDASKPMASVIDGWLKSL